jgi:hypothetical protein
MYIRARTRTLVPTMTLGAQSEAQGISAQVSSVVRCGFGRGTVRGLHRLDSFVQARQPCGGIGRYRAVRRVELQREVVEDVELLQEALVWPDGHACEIVIKVYDHGGRTVRTHLTIGRAARMSLSASAALRLREYIRYAATIVALRPGAARLG